MPNEVTVMYKVRVSVFAKEINTRIINDDIDI